MKRGAPSYSRNNMDDSHRKKGDGLMGISLPSSWLPGLQAATVLLLTAGFFFDQPLSVVPAIALAALVMSQDEEGAPAEFRPLTALLVLAGLLFLADYATYAWTLALVAAAYGLVVLVGFHPWSLIRQAAGEPAAPKARPRSTVRTPVAGRRRR